MSKRFYLFLFIISVSVLIMGVGYATVNDVTLSVNGSASADDNGIVKITNVALTNSSNVTASAPSWTDTDVSFSITFRLSNNDSSATDEHSATYHITILNDSIQSYVFSSDVFNPTITVTQVPRNETLNYSYEIIGLTLGEEIPAKTSKEFDVKVYLFPSGGAGTYSINADVEVGTEENNDGVLNGSINAPNTGDLSGSNTLAHFSANIMNSYQSAKQFTLTVNNNNFEIVDQNGNPFSNPFSINASTQSQTYDFYIKIKNNATFPNDTQRFNVILNPTDDSPITIGTVAITVDVDPSLTDYDPPTITSFTATKGNTTKTITLNWAATDTYGVDHYNLYMYNNNNTLVSQQLNITNTTYTFDNLSNGTYNFKLEAVDGSDNMSSQTIANTAYTWTYTVTITCNNCSANPNGGTVEAGATYTTTFSGTGNYNAPNNITSIYMYDSSTGTESQLTNGQYTYSTNNRRLTINNVTGNIRITASGVNQTCLVEGTKILLYNGKTKNIEDIDYDDLLAVWNHDTGTLTYEYPLWMENEHESNKYIEITFSDNTKLNIVNDHGLYDAEHKKYINRTDEEFKVGAKIAKITNDGTFTEVTITSIKEINKKVKYYFVGSTTYFNIIADNILTTDSKTLISNFYGFEDNAKWPDIKQDIVNDMRNILPYEYFKDVLPYYLFKGFRAGEVGYLINNNIMTVDQFRYYLSDLIVSEYYLKKPINKDGSNYWMVTTSEDDMINKEKYLHKEGTTYILPNNDNENFIGWLNTSDNKIYQANETITINHGLHFIAQYK